MPVAAIAAVATAGASIYGANKNSQAVKSAAAASQAGTDATIAEQRRQFDITQANQAPWQAAGVNALNKLQNPLQAFEASPDYAFRVKQGENSLASLAASGLGGYGLKSGAAVKDALRFGQDIGGAEFGNWWNRQAGLAGVGQSANTAVQNAGQNMANNVGIALNNNANQLGSSYLAGAQNTNNLIGGVTNALGYAAGNGAFNNIKWPWQGQGGYSPGPIMASGGWSV